MVIKRLAKDTDILMIFEIRGKQMENHYAIASILVASQSAQLVRATEMAIVLRVAHGKTNKPLLKICYDDLLISQKYPVCPLVLRKPVLYPIYNSRINQESSSCMNLTLYSVKFTKKIYLISSETLQAKNFEERIKKNFFLCAKKEQNFSNTIVHKNFGLFPAQFCTIRFPQKCLRTLRPKL